MNLQGFVISILLVSGLGNIIASATAGLCSETCCELQKSSSWSGFSGQGWKNASLVLFLSAVWGVWSIGQRPGKVRLPHPVR